MTQLFRRESPLGTLLQSLPRAMAVIRSMRPTWHFSTAAGLSSAFLAEQGIRGVLWDVDGTITRFHDTQIAPEVAGIEALLEEPSLRHAILSNADERRYLELGLIFPGIPILKGYRRGSEVVVRVLRGSEDSLDRAARQRLAAAGAVPLRKPDGGLVHAALGAIGVASHEAVMIGDQYFTDIAGANLAGIRSIKVDAIGWKALPPGIRFGQRLERVVYRIRHGRPVPLEVA